MSVSFSRKVCMHTENPVHEMYFRWSVDNFSYLPQSICSSVFKAALDCSQNWMAILQMSSSEGRPPSCMDFKIKRMSDEVHTNIVVRVHLDLSILNNAADVLAATKTDLDFGGELMERQVLQCVRPSESTVECGHDGTMFSLPEDVLIIEGNFKMSGCCVSTSIQP